ncbi:hypothetical protein BR93DRAFT_782307 [Coniochaeta sp. PMI_546]|nr:hypothetical protein BR93DRAFT_782307 [Coniochaeta sp. PMI_546]
MRFALTEGEGLSIPYTQYRHPSPFLLLLFFLLIFVGPPSSCQTCRDLTFDCL